MHEKLFLFPYDRHGAKSFLFLLSTAVFVVIIEAYFSGNN